MIYPPIVISQVTPRMCKSNWALDNINVYTVTNSQLERMMLKKIKHHWKHTPENGMYSLADPASRLDTSLGYKSNPSHRVRISISIPASMENLKITTRQTNIPKLRLKHTHTHSQNQPASRSLSESHVQLTVACAAYNHRALEPYLSLDYLS